MLTLPLISESSPSLQEHCQVSKRTLHVANLDPAAEHFEYEPAFDVKELINLETGIIT